MTDKPLTTPEGVFKTILKRLAEIILEQIYAHEYGKSEKCFYEHTEELKRIIASIQDEQ